MNMRISVLTGMALLLLFACGQGAQTATGTVTQQDADAVADGGPADTVVDTTPGPDLPGDSAPLADTAADSPLYDLVGSDLATTEVQGADADAQSDAGCQNANCALDCDKGFKKDDQGCDICACATCQTDVDCAMLSCSNAICDAKGACACGGCNDKAPKFYSCPGGATVPWCACSKTGYACIDQPELQCPTLCHAGQSVAYPCAMGDASWCACKPATCVPYCSQIGTPDEGWVDGCTGKSLKKEKCSDASVACTAIGSKSEGWSSSTTGLIGWTSCAPKWACGGAPQQACADKDCPAAIASFPCPGGEKPPICTCSAPASWSCDPEPWQGCKQPLACTPEGKTWNKTGGGFGLCCPGLTAVKAVVGDGKTCSAPSCDCWTCTACGDAQCGLGENACNCPSDCAPAAGLQGQGQACQATADCGQPLTCLGAVGGGTGICTRICKPGPPDDCGKGFICMVNPISAAPGACMKTCDTNAGCTGPLKCAAFNFSGPAPVSGGCFDWPDCDPMGNAFCEPGQQCFLVEGKTACGAPGKLAKGAVCDPAAMACGPGLACGSLKQCAPVCSWDEGCKTLGYDFCQKLPTGAAWGQCMHYVK